jgi:Zn-dependent protease
MPDASFCPDCGTEVAPSLLTCPNCQRLVHADRLKALSAEAEAATRADDPTAALIAWRSALELLPPGSRQHNAISARVSELGRVVDSRPGSSPAPKAGSGAVASGLGTLAIVAWKLKTVGILILTKGKLLLLGLTKAGTLSSMFLSLGVYATALGWEFALGLVVSIYIHEMGHVAALMRYGVKASAPLFIPGLGALIRMRQELGDPRQDARVGLAGPVWGCGAAVGSYLIWLATGEPIWAGVAHFGALINLFNLLPLGPLDGGRAFNALNRPQRWFAVMAIAAAWSMTPESMTNGMLILLMLVGVMRAASGKAPSQPDPGALTGYVLLMAALTWLTFLAPAPVFPGG